MEDFLDETMLENQPLTQEQLRNMSDGPTLIFMILVMIVMAIGACISDHFKEVTIAERDLLCTDTGPRQGVTKPLSQTSTRAHSRG